MKKLISLILITFLCLFFISCDTKSRVNPYEDIRHTKYSGFKQICLYGVLYWHQINGGMTPVYWEDGSISTCKEKTQ